MNVEEATTIAVLLISTIAGIAYGYISNLDNSSSFYIYSIITIFINITFGIYIIDIIKTHIKERKLCKVDPLFYIQSYKSSILEEKLIKYAQLGILIISFVCLINMIGKSGQIESKDVLVSYLSDLEWFTCTLFMVIYLSLYTPKGKHIVVYNDGILAFSYYMPWDSIQGYMWSKESKDDKEFYSLEFSVWKKAKIGKHRAPIKVSSSQVSLINELLKNNNINEIC